MMFQVEEAKGLNKKLKVLQKLIYIILLSIPFYAKSQNLIRNGGFEIRTKFNNVLLNPYSNLDKVKYWNNPNRCSPDIHKSGVNDKILKLGQSKPFSGMYYVGIGHHDNGFRDEYIETKLKKKLKKDSLYCIKMYVTPDSKNNYYLSRLYVAFSEKYYHQRERKFFFLPDTLGFTHPEKTIIINDADYIEVSNIYKSKGEEKYFLIGNFNKNNRYYYLNSFKDKHKTEALGYKYSYYYFDDISVTPIKDSSECPCYHYKKPKHYKETEILRVNQLSGKKYVLSNLKFSTKNSKMVLNPATKDELQAITETLQKDSLLKITIISHVFETDVMLQNKKLSEERAKALKDYFVSQKLNTTRIETIGMGSGQPLFDNDSREHQDKNTRVELRFD